MRYFTWVVSLAVMSTLVHSARSQEAQPPAESTPESKASQDKAKQALKEAVDLVKSIRDGTKKFDTDMETFATRMTEQLEASTLVAIARAQLVTGDKAAAGSTFERALDAAEEVDDHGHKANILAAIAIGQADAGDRPTALATLKQALRAARTLKRDREMPMMRETSAEEAKALALVRVAATQLKIGDKDSSRATVGEAVQLADGLKDPARRAAVLVAVAVAQDKGNDAEEAAGSWTRATKFALSIDDEFKKARAVEGLVRERLKAGRADATVQMADSELSGDLKSYALWAIADQLVRNDAKPERKTVDDLLRLAGKADYDRFSKRVKVFLRVGDAQVKSGDGEGAIGTVESVDDGHFNHYRIVRAKIGILRTMAAALVKAGDKNSAQRIYRDIRELGATFHDEDGLAGLEWSEIAAEQAQAGDLDGARQTAEAIGDLDYKVDAFAGIAAAQAKAGDKPGATDSIRAAEALLPKIPNQTLWSLPQIDFPGFAGSFQTNPTARSRRALAVAMARTGDLPGALKAAKALSGEESDGPGFGEWEVFETISNLQIEAAQWQAAREAIVAYPSKESYYEQNRSKAFARLAKAQTKAGDLTGVMQWVKDVKAAQSKAAALQGLARGISSQDNDGRPLTASDDEVTNLGLW